MGVGIPRMLRQRGMIALLEDIVVSVVPFLSLETVHAILFVYVQERMPITRSHCQAPVRQTEFSQVSRLSSCVGTLVQC